MIIRSLKNQLVKNSENVIGLYQSLHQWGSTCPCHGTPIAQCSNPPSQSLQTNHVSPVFISTSTSNAILSSPSPSSSSSTSSYNRSVYNNASVSSIRHDMDLIQKFGSWSSDNRATRRYSSGIIVEPSQTEYAFEMATSNIKFGPGCTHEIGQDLIDLKIKNVCVFADPHLLAMSTTGTGGESPVSVVLHSLKKAGINFVIYSNISIEPTDESFKDAIEFVKNARIPIEGFVAVGGGSTIDTCKAANLYTTFPTDNFLDYVNPIIGLGKPVPGPVKPLIAVPTTAGTGSETTGVSVFDLLELKAKTGIAHKNLKPTLGIVDPHNTFTMPTNVAVASGFDQLCHALESYTAIPYNKRTRTPIRPAYQGSNPISDIWSLKALEMINEYLPTAIENPTDLNARSQVMLAATSAGIGFGNAGVHLCHGMSYAVSGLVRDYKPEGYNVDYPIIPHGMSVCLNAPAVFEFTASANPARHLECARLMGANINNVKDQDAGKILSNQIRKLMKRLKIPDGLKAINYTKDDIPALVQGTLPQHRVTKLSPRPVGVEELTKLFENSMTIY
ncbi:iron-containing alcohol dehydrogenase [Cavenderia fasciculata]|uniref:hydroxyacid-oxoacid transhydrogenase n=1 Tax=Cavenderia fasciculata TaxID=261658 RepID=F4PTP3_CACFS|nr:iron-containing alcohol dehydrogenase [Cavenderia fasciculata]EGG21713.1 iron-containing alcohol dehydrogenase [Cavenderia fasciculata]|eukprot:XP_004359563.1 iron-containing alcohol dehydrogenase [Cavenderia fasciculata]